MPKPLQTGLLIIALLGIGGLGAYAYVVRPTKAPTQPLEARNAESSQPDAYAIVPERSTATFSLQEDLRGERITVVGVTHDVSGTVTADRANLTGAQLGSIRINARTFVTDSEQRNNAIRRLILKTETDANEFIIFTPNLISQLPTSVEVGQTFPFEISGDLTVSGATKPVTFTGTAAFTSETEITGRAETVVHYPDFGISVPNLPFLANVEQDAKLTIEFVAAR